MKKSEFLQKWDEEILRYADVIVGKRTNIPYSTNCYEENGLWVISVVGERQDESIRLRDDESLVFDELDTIMCVKVKQNGLLSS